MAYCILTTVSGHPEQFDLDSLPLLSWTDPQDPQNTSKRSARELLQEGKIGVHDLYRLLAAKRIRGIESSMGAQALLIAWARHLKAEAEKAQELIGIAGAKS